MTMKKTITALAVASLLMCTLIPASLALTCDDFDYTPPEGFAEVTQVIPGSYAWQDKSSGSSLSLVVQDNDGHFDNTTLDEDELKKFSADYESQYKDTYASLGDKGYTVEFAVEESSVKTFGDNTALYTKSLLKLTANGKTQKKTQYAANFYRENKTYTFTYLVTGTAEKEEAQFSDMAASIVIKDDAYIPSEGYGGIIVICIFSAVAVCVLSGAAAVYVNKKKRLEEEEAQRLSEKSGSPAEAREKKKHKKK